MPKKRVTRKLADGTIKVYEYEIGKSKQSSNTVENLIKEYHASPEYKRLKPSTAFTYDRAFKRILEWYGAVPVESIRRRHVKAMRDELSDKPGLANQLLTAWALVLQLAVEQEYVGSNVASRIKRLDVGSYARWPDHVIDVALHRMPEYLARSITLALYTGQREGDCIRMTWADYDGAAIRVTQEKTGAKLWVPCHRDLKAELERWKASAPRTATTILVSSRGTPWRDGKAFSSMFARVKNKFPQLNGFVFHGLRKSAAARLAEAGCSVHEIAAITGHMSLQMVQHYTKEADQKRNAIAAVKKLEDYRR